MAFDSGMQRKIMGHFATGVTVVTSGGEEPAGLTANSVTSLSLDPPLVLFALAKKSGAQQAFRDSGCFAMSILSSAQQEISNRFAAPGPKEFSDLNTCTAETGAPILAESMGWVDCRLSEVLEGGDHDIFIGEIVAGDILQDGGEPLLYYAGGYREI
ncbi:MAG: flavin reductase family protein, partial [Planctomycetaceae bacterium]